MCSVNCLPDPQTLHPFSPERLSNGLFCGFVWAILGPFGSQSRAGGGGGWSPEALLGPWASLGARKRACLGALAGTWRLPFAEKLSFGMDFAGFVESGIELFVASSTYSAGGVLYFGDWGLEFASPQWLS